jgi:hypothetical protein
MRARRDLTNAALALFIKHYFSIPWLREYLLNRKIKFEIENKLFEDETINDLLFLIRMCHEWSVTAKSLSEIMTRFEDLDSEKASSYRHGTSTFLMSSYFFAQITSRMRTPDENLSELWRQVAMMPMEDQYKFDYYSLAKKREAALLGYQVERKLWELLEENRQLQKKCFLADIEKATKTILEPYLTAEWRTRSKMELQHYFDDRIKYYRFLSDQARAKGNNLLSDAWEQVAEEEEIGIPGTLGSVAKKLLPLRAWSLERATNLTSSVRTIYQIAFQFFESGSIESGKDIVKLAMSVEDLLKLLKKWKNLILQQKYADKQNEPEGSMTKLFDIMENMIAHFHDQLVLLISNARVEDFSEWNKVLDRMKKKFVKHKDDYESHYREFQLALVKFRLLSSALKHYESFVAVLKTRMEEYRSDLTNYFEQEYEIHCILEEENGSTTSAVGSSAGFSMYSPTACHSQFFLRFPFEKELLTYVERIEKVSEVTRVAELFQVVVDEILYYISTVVLSVANLQIYSRKGFKLDAYYDRYFTGLSKALGPLSLESDVQTTENDLDLTSSFIYCYRDLIQYHGIDPKKADKLYFCLADIWTHRVFQEKKVQELLSHWRTTLLYFQKSSYRIEKAHGEEVESSIVIDKELEEYHKKVYYHAGLQLINLVGLATGTRTSPYKMEFLIEVATYFEEERNFQANCSFLRGALNFFATDGKTTTTTSPSANDVLSLQIEYLNDVDNPWIEKWNSLAIAEVFSPAVDIMYSTSPPFGEEKMLILNFLYETLICAVNRWEPFYEQWSLLVQKLNEMKYKSGMTSLKYRTGLLKRLQAYYQYATENETVKKLELEDLKRICKYVVQRENHTTDPKMASSDSLKNALKLFNQGLKLFDSETTKDNNNDNSDRSIVSEDQIYLCFRLSALYLKLDELLAQQTAGVEKLEEEIETVSVNIQQFITENPMIKSWLTE